MTAKVKKRKEITEGSNSLILFIYIIDIKIECGFNVNAGDIEKVKR